MPWPILECDESFFVPFDKYIYIEIQNTASNNIGKYDISFKIPDTCYYFDILMFSWVEVKKKVCSGENCLNDLILFISWNVNSIIIQLAGG